MVRQRNNKSQANDYLNPLPGFVLCVDNPAD